MTLKTVLSKPIKVIWFRLVQLLRLKYLEQTDFWNKKSISISNFCWNRNHPGTASSSLFADDFDPTNKQYQELILNDNAVDNILEGKIYVFDKPYHFEFPLPWHTDWRNGHQWKNDYFKNYNFYEPEKEENYDVKFPWELSRLSFLIPVARKLLITNNAKYLEFIHDQLADFKEKNPLAHSVNWYPMEVSVRSINIIQLREIVLRVPSSETTVCLLNELLLQHGVFLWRNIEYTDVRGNHYTANLTALLLLGQIFQDNYPESCEWREYALEHLEMEFHLQFLEDGVNFEKSIPYHRLVVELFLISFLIMQRNGKNLKPETLAVLKNACDFIDAYQKPNGTSPVIGDNDSASIFQHDGIRLNDHSNLLHLASQFFRTSYHVDSQLIYPSSYELFGEPVILEIKDLPDTIDNFHFESGGFIIAKTSDDYLITDVGEVGMKGRGGHGHNDLFSFELQLDKHDLIVDPGCFTYTGDLTLKNLMKSSAYHNILMVDREEIAPLIGNWGISNVAEPFEVFMEEGPSFITISGKHVGFKRLPDPVEHKRSIKIEKNTFKVIVTDNVRGSAKYGVSRFLHFAPGAKLQLETDCCTVVNRGRKYKVNFAPGTSAVIETYTQSYNYGTKVSAEKIILSDQVEGDEVLEYSISKMS